MSATMLRCLATLALAVACAVATAPLLAGEPEPPSSAARIAAFELDLVLTRGEKSKDSHSSTCKVTIRGLAVTYEGPVGRPVRGRSQSASASFELAEVDLAKLIELVERAGSESFEEVRERSGYGSYVSASATVRDQSEARTLRIAGMTHVSGAASLAEDGASELELSEAAQDRTQALASVCSQLKSVAEAELGVD